MHVDRMLAAAQKTFASVKYCWLIIPSDETVCARPMGRLPPSEGDDDWTIRFLTDLRSRKIAHLRRTAAVSLIFQDDREDAYASVSGSLRLIEIASKVQALSKGDLPARYFPTETDRAHAGFVEVSLERMELWIRGVTPEPFGQRTTTLRRDPPGSWHLAA